MKGENKNIESFLKDKLDGFDAGYQSDWSEFEHKLDRAILYYRLKVGALVGVVLILITLGIAGAGGLGDPARVNKPTASQPSFIYDLRSRAPFLVGIRNGNKNRTGNEVKSHGNTGDVAAMGVSTLKAGGEQLMAAVSTGNTSDDQSLQLKMKQPELPMAASSLAMKSSAPRSVIPPKVETASAHSPKWESKKPLADADGKKFADLDQRSQRKTNIPAGMELDLKGLNKELEKGRQSELGVRPPILPVTLRRRAPYVSPMQGKNRWSYSISVYPNFTFRKFKVDREKMDLIHRDFIDATQEAESGGFSLNIGFVVSRRIGRITYLNGGVEYINYKTRAEYDFYNYRRANINPQTDQILSYSLMNEPELIRFSGNNVYHYLNLPLSISHRPWATDHIRLNIEAGGSFMYFMGARGQAIDYQSLEVIDIADREYNNSIASLHMKVGVCYHVSPKLNFGLEPTFMYFTNTIYSEDYPFQVIPYSVGVNLKLQVKLN